jgi:hypothetical protein
MQSETQPKTTEELIQEFKGLQASLEETATQLRREKGRKSLWRVVALVTVAICLYETKSKTVWLPVADSQQMCVVMSDWWSLRVQAYYPVWRKPTGETAEYSEQWCIKYQDNSWRVFYDSHGRVPAYRCPPVVHGTYF